MGNYFIYTLRAHYSQFGKAFGSEKLTFKATFLFLLGVIFNIQLFAQCPVVDNTTGFGLPAVVCPDVPFLLTNPMPGQARYEWDFCANEIMNTPVANVYATVPLANAPFKPKLLLDNGEYFLFTIAASNNNIIRMDLGTNPNNYPISYVNLNNFGTDVNSPAGIDFYKEGSNWYALVVNYSNGLSRLSFGNSLKNIPVAQVLGNFGGWNSSTNIAVASDGTNVYAWYSNGNLDRIDVINFGNSITNNINASSIIHSISFPNGSYPYDFKAVKDCSTNIWSILGINAGNGGYFRLRYDTGFLNLPTVSNLPNTLSFGVSGIDFIQINDKYYGYVSGFSGENASLTYGTNISTSNPIVQNLNSPSTSTSFNSFVGLTLTKYQDKYLAYGINYINNIIFKIDFQQACKANIGFSTAENPPSISYHATGTFPISLRVYNASNQLIKTYTKNITVNPTATIAEFNAPEVCTGQTTNFINNSIGADANVSSWAWNFGDGNTSSLKTPAYTYASSGSYNTTLTVTNTNGCINTYSQTSRVSAGVTANFTANPTYCVGQAINFPNNSTHTNVEFDDASGFYWDFGDFTYSPFKNPNKIYTTAGTYNVQLTVKDKAGCTNTVSKSINVINAPVANFTFPTTICAGTPITFTNNSTGSITGYQWNIEGIGIRTEASPIITFASAGQYDVSLMVTNTNGCQITYAVDNIVVNALPKPDFIAKKNSSNILNYTFQNQSIGIGTFVWDFGNGIKSADTSPTYTYPQQGEYSVNLSVTGSGSCVQTISKIVQIGTANYDLSIQNASIDADGIAQISFKNNSNFSVDSVNIVAQVGSEEIKNIYKNRVAPTDVGVYSFAIPLDLLQKNPYVCLRVSLKTPLRENYLDNNTSCFNLSGKFQVFAPFPNPASKSISVAYTCPTNDFVELIIYDAIGRKIVQTLNGSTGYNEQKINISSFYTGIYIFQFQYKGEVFNKKVVIE
jgi:PKD repeat protein